MKIYEMEYKWKCRGDDNFKEDRVHIAATDFLKAARKANRYVKKIRRQHPTLVGVRVCSVGEPIYDFEAFIK